MPQIPYQVWLLAVGRLLSQVGSGFTLVYAPIFFVNHVGFSASAVGVGLGSASVSGVVGRIVGGSLADSPLWGRKRTILLSAIISAIASLGLAITFDFPVFVAGNLLMGLGIGLYWPATEALVADLTTPEQHNEAFALTRLSDSLGLGTGVVLGGLLIDTTGAYRWLFVIDAISYLVFFALIGIAIKELTKPEAQPQSFFSGWSVALRDRILLVYAGVNVLFTLYIVQIYSTIPLYLSNFVTTGASNQGFSTTVISGLFAWHLFISVICQLPSARALNRIRHPQALMLSALLWGLGFSLIWVTGTVVGYELSWAALGLAVLAISTVTYLPAASSLVVELAPESLRGVYFSINSQCWALGYLVGPPLGGLALDQPRPIPDYFWLGLTLSVSVTIGVLSYLDQALQLKQQ